MMMVGNEKEGDTELEREGDRQRQREVHRQTYVQTPTTKTKRHRDFRETEMGQSEERKKQQRERERERDKEIWRERWKEKTRGRSRETEKYGLNFLNGRNQSSVKTHVSNTTSEAWLHEESTRYEIQDIRILRYKGRNVLAVLFPEQVWPCSIK